MAEYIQPQAPDFASTSLADILKTVSGKNLPPVEQWNPTHCGDSDMRIASDGTWFYAGSPIGRHALVRLFSTVLRREPDGSYVLVTPVEKLSIAVDDAPFVAVEVMAEGEGKERSLAFRLNEETLVVAGPGNPIRVETEADGTPRPYIHVRGKIGNGLEALINRPVFYQLANLALEETAEGDAVGLWSGGVFHAFAD